MDDLQMVKKCAERIGIELETQDAWGNETCEVFYFDETGARRDYDPLHDDAQAMALVKNLRLMIWTETAYWLVADSECEDRFRAMNTDLNRAIVECVSKIV